MVNGKPINFVIGQYVERKDVGGLAEFFRAYISDVADALEEALQSRDKEIIALIDSFKIDTSTPPTTEEYAPGLVADADSDSVWKARNRKIDDIKSAIIKQEV